MSLNFNSVMGTIIVLIIQMSLLSALLVSETQELTCIREALDTFQQHSWFIHTTWHNMVTFTLLFHKPDYVNPLIENTIIYVVHETSLFIGPFEISRTREKIMYIARE